MATKQVSVVGVKFQDSLVGMYGRIFIAWEQGTIHGRSKGYVPSAKLMMCQGVTFRVGEGPVTISLTVIPRSGPSIGRTGSVTFDPSDGRK
jgi:hypothetical protein